jgi:hypothetical protein
MRTRLQRWVWVLVLLGALPCFGQGNEQLTEEQMAELAKTSQNPVGDLISLPFQNNNNIYWGPFDRSQNVMNIQPVIPTPINKNWNLINRTIVPVIHQPIGDSDSENGIGDILYEGFFSPRDVGKVIWGVGPMVQLPTATDDALGTDKWSLGPGVVILTMPGQWVIGGVLLNVWSVAGDSAAADVNFFTFQYFVNYNFPNHWYLATAPILTANWEAESGEQWTVPFGVGIGKVFNIGSQPHNVSAHLYYNVERPTFASQWQFRFQWTLLFPKGKKS